MSQSKPYVNVVTFLMPLKSDSTNHSIFRKPRWPTLKYCIHRLVYKMLMCIFKASVEFSYSFFTFLLFGNVFYKGDITNHSRVSDF